MGRRDTEKRDLPPSGSRASRSATRTCARFDLFAWGGTMIEDLGSRQDAARVRPWVAPPPLPSASFHANNALGGAARCAVIPRHRRVWWPVTTGPCARFTCRSERRRTKTSNRHEEKTMGERDLAPLISWMAYGIFPARQSFSPSSAQPPGALPGRYCRPPLRPILPTLGAAVPVHATAACSWLAPHHAPASLAPVEAGVEHERVRRVACERQATGNGWMSCRTGNASPVATSKVITRNVVVMPRLPNWRGSPLDGSRAEERHKKGTSGKSARFLHPPRGCRRLVLVAP